MNVAARVARAADLFERHRTRLTELSGAAAELAKIDVIVVKGERDALARLEELLGRARGLLAKLADDVDDTVVLQRLEAHLAPNPWSVLDEVERLLTQKAAIAETARTTLQRRLAPWKPVALRVEAADEIHVRYPHAAERRDLYQSRSRTRDLLRQANRGFSTTQFLDAWRALDELENIAQPVAPADVPKRLDELIAEARASAGRLQLTVLGGPLDAATVEYTMILLTLTGNRDIGDNLHDTSTLVRRNRNDMMLVGYAVSADRYRVLRDGRPPAGLAATPPDRDVMQRLREIGHDLYHLMIPDHMKEIISRQHPDTPIMIMTNDGLLPWELMFDDDFLALSRPVVRMPVGRTAPRRTAPAEQSAALRTVALVASAGPAGELSNAVREVEQIRIGLLEAWGSAVQVDVFVTGTERDASGAQFDRLLKSRDYDIIHYAGHARFDSRRPRRSGLLLDHAELCSADKIQRLLAGNPLVFLNACESARLRQDDGREPVEGAYEEGPVEGIADAFLYGGAPACIGNMWIVPDAVAATFAIKFYAEALDGQPLGQALRAARKHTAEAHPGDPSWASFVLYGDPSFRLAMLATPDSAAD